VVQNLLEKVAEDDYRASARSLEIQGNQLSSSTVGRVLCREGEALERDLFGAAALLSNVCQARTNPPKLLLISGDGSRYRTNEADHRKTQPRKQIDPKDHGWRENKIGVVVRAARGHYDEAGKYHPSEELLKTYVASTDSINVFGRMLHLEAERRGVKEACEVVFVSDNGHGLPEMRRREFPQAHVVTDFYHTTERLYECATVIKGEGPANEKARKRFWHGLKDRLWRGHVEKLIPLLTDAACALAPRPEQLSDLGEQPAAHTLWTHIFYLEKNKGTMDYPTYRANGWPIGSGTIESACGQFGNRFKHTRMRWTKRIANAGHQVKAAILSEDGRWQRRWPPAVPVLPLPEWN
jgi:hypothetical protein